MGLGSIFDPAGVFSGDKGDVVNNLLDPMGGFLQNNPEFDPFGANDFHNDVGEWMDDLGDTTELLAKSRSRNVWSEIRNGDMLKRDASTGFSGFGGSPIGTRFTNKINAEDDTPLWDMYGGATPNDYQYVADKGQDSSAHEGLGAVGSSIGKGVINAFTYGLGSTALDALNAYGYGQDASGEDLVKNAVKNYYLGQAFDYGMGNTDFGQMVGAGEYSPIVNKAVRSGTSNAGAIAANGGNSSEIGQGFLTGAGQGAVKGGGDMAKGYLGGAFDDEMPDVGTIGGTMTDEEGENSATLGGVITPTQTNANLQKQQAMSGSEQSSPVFSALMSAINGGTGSESLGSLADFGTSLYGIYNARKQRNALRDQQTNLQNMFGPNSPYAQQMRQRLERKDAAGGRRSQYGPREAQLAALLADRQAQTMPHQMNLQNAIYGLDNQMVNAGFRGLNQGRKAIPGLMSLFGGGQ